MRVLIILSCMLGASLSCSCARMRLSKAMCNDEDYILRVAITEITKHEKPTRGYNWGSYSGPGEEGPVTEVPPPTTSSPNMYERELRIVSANITQVYRGGDGKGDEVGESIQLSSSVVDSMCGMGYYLTPGAEFVLKTNDLSKKSVGLCMFFFKVGGWAWDTAGPIINNMDCTCKARDCKLRQGKRVFRGACNSPEAFCMRDKKGVCRWTDNADLSENNLTIEDCKNTRGWW